MLLSTLPQFYYQYYHSATVGVPTLLLSMLPQCYCQYFHSVAASVTTVFLSMLPQCHLEERQPRPDCPRNQVDNRLSNGPPVDRGILCGHLMRLSVGQLEDLARTLGMPDRHVHDMRCRSVDTLEIVRIETNTRCMWQFK